MPCLHSVVGADFILVYFERELGGRLEGEQNKQERKASAKALRQKHT